MKAVTVLRLGLALIALASGAGAAVLSNGIGESQEAARSILRHESAWAAANGRHEVLMLGKAAAVYNASPTTAHRRDLEVAYSILVGRVKLLKEGAFSKVIESSQDRRERFQAFAAVVDRLGPLVHALPAENAWTALLPLVDEASGLITRIATDSQALGLAQAAKIGDDIQGDLALENYLLLGLAFSVVALVGLSEFQNRLLLRATANANDARGRFEFLARHDPLTTLPNRTTFGESLQQALRKNSPVAVFVLDLDGFKPINDTLGHVAGDRILCSVAERLRRLRESDDDVVSRFGGDEFVLLVHGLKDRAAALRHADRIRRELRLPHHIGAHTMVVDASIGCALSTGAERDLDLFHQADIALNNAKSNGRAQVAVFQPQLLTDVERRARLQRGLDFALMNKQIYAVYQPQLDLATGTLVAVEALARWKHPTYGEVPPGEFIPVAELSGHISEIGEFILATACADAANWMPSDIQVSVNVSAAQLADEGFPEAVRAALNQSGLPPHRLMLEITETAIMRDPVRATQSIRRLGEAGVAVSVDDFGTGHSSLAQLRNFHLHELKIDRTFVKNMEASREDVAIVRSIVRLARTLKLTTVAEGVENEKQLALLRKLGCDRAQGYLIGRPAPIDEVLSVAEPERKLA